MERPRLLCTQATDGPVMLIVDGQSWSTAIQTLHRISPQKQLYVRAESNGWGYCHPVHAPLLKEQRRS